ncbi:MAG TPA: polymer-forming cytoskeletal protein [Polyangiaceae bacterium]|nr:polymer-forming cytoskeletal protein [Polyangiaceae bacterium]
MTSPTAGVHERKTTIEEGTHLKGSLVSKCAVEVKGRIEGDVTAPALFVAASGAVHGRVKVGEIRSQGELSGEFDANVVQLSGAVRDNTVIRAKSLEVKLAPPEGKTQVVFGECSLEVGVEPTQLDAQSRAPAVRALGARPPTDANGS